MLTYLNLHVTNVPFKCSVNVRNTIKREAIPRENSSKVQPTDF